MAKRQERATRTRASLLESAARHFDDVGYSSTSLAQVCETARMSVGAITFHFANKADLADAVEHEGRVRAATVLGSMATAEAPLGAVVELIMAFVRLLEHDVMVRAALRLAHERAAVDLLTDVWLPTVAAPVRRAFADGRPDVETPVQTVVDLAEYLARGAEALWRYAPAAQRDGARLRAVCELAFRGAWSGRPDGRPSPAVP